MFAGGTGSFLPVTSLRASVVDQNAVFNINNLVHIFLMGAMVLIPVALFAWPLATGRRTRFAFVLAALSIAGSFCSAAFYPHYAAPAVAPILILITGAYRYLRHARFGPTLAMLMPGCAIGLSLLDGPALLREPPFSYRE
jgi:4-amino-4-deoxy-L-arabinose transferase-like glycosyltransferase